MFSQVRVKNSVHGGGSVGWACMAGGGVAGGMCGRRGGWEACVQERWPLKRAVRILLECILVGI